MTDNDICICGDYRLHHKDGQGACGLNDLGHNGAPACQSFRLASHQEPEEQGPSDGGE